MIVVIFAKRGLFGLLTGAGITAVVQSSSVTTVLVVGFITAGLMTFIQSIPVILGANVGTTITAQIVAFEPHVSLRLWNTLLGDLRHSMRFIHQAGRSDADAVARQYAERGWNVIATARKPEKADALKALAAERDDMHNAAVGFDFDNMAPTFRMKFGVPGSSNALEVARRYGIPFDVIDDARALLPDHSLSFETLAAKLEAATEAEVLLFDLA